MNLKEQIKSLLKQAELYRTQGLLNEARMKFNEIVDLIKSNDQIQNKEKLLEGVQKKIQMLDGDFQKLQEAPVTPEMDEKVQDLIKKLYSFSDDQSEEAAEFEGAIALAKFGQFERAKDEFKAILEKKNKFRFLAAKNILRCYGAISNYDQATQDYEAWVAANIFTSDQLEKIRIFFKDMLEKKGVEITIPGLNEPIEAKEAEPAEEGAEELPPTIPETMPESDVEEEEILDISSIGIMIEEGSQKGRQIELDVSFQSGNIISIIISGKEKELVESLQAGLKLNDVQFYSPIAIFKGSGTVSTVTKINSGPKQGDYSVDIRIESV